MPINSKELDKIDGNTLNLENFSQKEYICKGCGEQMLHKSRFCADCYYEISKTDKD